MATKTIWRLPVVMARTGLSRSSIYAKMAAGDFPPSINLGPRAVGWISDEVIGWLEVQIDRSRNRDKS